MYHIFLYFIDFFHIDAWFFFPFKYFKYTRKLFEGCVFDLVEFFNLCKNIFFQFLELL